MPAKRVQHRTVAASKCGNLQGRTVESIMVRAGTVRVENNRLMVGGPILTYKSANSKAGCDAGNRAGADVPSDTANGSQGTENVGWGFRGLWSDMGVRLERVEKVEDIDLPYWRVEGDIDRPEHVLVTE